MKNPYAGWRLPKWDDPPPRNLKWYHDDKVQMLLNTYFPNRKLFRAHWESEAGKWVEG